MLNGSKKDDIIVVVINLHLCCQFSPRECCLHDMMQFLCLSMVIDSILPGKLWWRLID